MIRKLLLCLCLLVSSLCALEIKEGYVPVNGTELFYRMAGKGVPLIVLHGGPGLDQGYLEPQLYKLAENNLVIFYDQRGSGRSLGTALDEKHINIHQFVEDIEGLRKALGVDKFVLAGHSWGGLLAMEYAVEHQENLLGLILISSAPADYKGMMAFEEEFGVKTKPISDLTKQLFTFDEFKKLNAEQIADGYRKLFSFYCYNPEKANELSLPIHVESAQSGFKVMEQIAKEYPCLNLFPKLKNLTVPTFILHGKQDIMPAWTAQEIKQAIPKSEIVLIDQCSHFPYVERPEQFFMEMNRFLQKINSP